MKYLLIFALILLFVFPPFSAKGAYLTMVSDTISNSAPGVEANHIIRFTLNQAVPASGSIVVAPAKDAFDIPLGMGAGDVAISLNGSWLGNQEVEASFGYGDSASIVLKLSASTAIVANSKLIIKIGTGGKAIKNPVATGSYKIQLATYDQANQLLDEAWALVAIISPVTGSSDLVDPNTPPLPMPSVNGGGSSGDSINPTSPVPIISAKKKADLNNDNKVTLADFSILAYWYNRPSPPQEADLNGDGEVNLVDFSILAFYWTG